MIKMKKNRFIVTLIGVILGTILLMGACLYAYIQVQDVVLVSKKSYDDLSDMGEKYSKLYLMHETLKEKSLYGLNEDKAMEAMCRAMADSVGDKYTSYLNEEELKKWTEYTQGSFTGVGIAFIKDEKTGAFLITSILHDGPAESAGLKKGDEILKVDGKSIEDSEAMQKALRGDAGTSVEVTYKRDKKIKSVSLVRGEVEETSVYSGVLDKKYGYIAISAFEKNTAEQFKRELSGLENKGLKSMIIDLRGNPGGLVDQSVEIADMLLPEGTITYTEDKKGEKKYYNSDENCTKMKYVVLVDENSASSSEILAAAIKDNEGGKIVGSTTFGKGIIQGIIEFNDKTALKLTYMQYFSPKGEKIQGVGVKPDYQVEQPKNAKTDKQMEKALELLKS